MAMDMGMCLKVLHHKELFPVTICKFPLTLDNKCYTCLQILTNSSCKFRHFHEAAALSMLTTHGRNIVKMVGDAQKCHCTNAMNSGVLEVLNSGISSLKYKNEKVTKSSRKKMASSADDMGSIKETNSIKTLDSRVLKKLILGIENGEVPMKPSEAMMVNRKRKKIMGVAQKAHFTLARNSKSLEELKSGDQQVRKSSGKTMLRSSEEFIKASERRDAAKRSDLDGTTEGQRSSTQSSRNEIIPKKNEKDKANSPETQARIRLDMCSKRGDVMGAIALYHSTLRDGVKLNQYHYTVLLYLCSSAAMGVVQPAKSGTRDLNSAVLEGTETEDELEEDMTEGAKDCNREETNMQSPRMFSTESDESTVKDIRNADISRGLSATFSETNLEGRRNLDTDHTDSGTVCDLSMINHEDEFEIVKEDKCNKKKSLILVGADLKQYALSRGFEIYERMISEEIPMNEATLTSVARMAMAMGNGELAFDIVKKMKAIDITPRLRSYGPALFCFCNSGDLDNAFKVEEDMMSSGVYPEEPELEALLKVSVGAGRADKVYYLMHKLRKSVRQVPLPITELIEQWFKSKAASRVGKRKWDPETINKAMKNGGGGWHGVGWLGSGKWTVVHTSIGEEGVCSHCKERLDTIDIDPIETEAFANSVASIARKRERNSSFQNFQNWLNYYGPFEAVVDAANVGLFSQRRFSIPKINAVVNGMRKKFPSRKWPLIIVHNKRIKGGRADDPLNKKTIEKWRNADALYATPTGSNDDWYWLYAAIKCKCLLVTNDEMRDHIFQMLGNDFFPRWKERHQVHFSFSDVGVEFDMPPACSVVIQESKQGHWHVPVAAECRESERDRIWLCVTRAKQRKLAQKSMAESGEIYACEMDGDASAFAAIKSRNVTSNTSQGLPSFCNKQKGQTFHKSFVSQKPQTVASQIMAAEEFGGCILDFQI